MINAGRLTTGEIREIVGSGDVEKIASIPKEYLDIFYENEKARSLWGVRGMKALYNGLCEQAVNDYKKAHSKTLFLNEYGRHGIKSRYENILENFFETDLFLNVSGLRSKEHAIKTIEQGMIDDKISGLESEVGSLNDILAESQNEIEQLKKELKELAAKNKLLAKENRTLKKKGGNQNDHSVKRNTERKPGDSDAAEKDVTAPL